MLKARSQMRLLIAVGVVAGLSGIYLQTIVAFRERFLVSLNLFWLCVIGLFTTLAVCAAAVFARRAGTSGPVAILIAATAGLLAAAIYYPIAGAVWGLLLGTVLTYGRDHAALLIRPLIAAARLAAVLGVGFGGVFLARRVYIDAGSALWAGLLIFLLTVVAQVAVFVAPIPSWFQAEASRRGWRRRIAKCCLVGIALIGLPVCWFAGWHAELVSRVRAIEAKGGSVDFDWHPVPLAAAEALRKGDFSMQGVRALPITDWTDWQAQWKRELNRYLLVGPPAYRVFLYNANRRDVRTLSVLHGVERLFISGNETDDSVLAELPQLPDVGSLTIQASRVTGEFLADPDLLLGVTEISVDASPFSNTGLSYLAARRDLTTFDLRGTQATSVGLAHLRRLPNWPLLDGDVPFDGQTWRLFSSAAAAADTDSDGIVSPAKETVFFYAKFELPELTEEVVSSLHQMPDKVYSHLRLSRDRAYDPNLLQLLEGLKNVQLTRTPEDAHEVVVSHVPASIRILKNLADQGTIRFSMGSVADLALRAVISAGPQAAPDVLQLIDDLEVTGDWRVRALCAIGPAAVPALIESFEDPDAATSWMAVQGVSLLGSEATAGVPALIEILESRDSEIRWKAAYALGRIGPSAAVAVRALVEALEDEDAVVRSTAAQALGEIGPDAAPAVPTLIRFLDVEDPSARLTAVSATALGAIGPDAADAVPMLVRLLDVEDSDARLAAVTALGGIGRPADAAVPMLIESLEDETTRPHAALALAGVATEAAVAAAVPALVVSLEDGEANPHDRAKAAAALGKLGPAASEAVPALIRSLENKWLRGTAGWDALDALERIGPGEEDILPILMAVLDHEELRGIALRRIGEPALPAVINGLYAQKRAVREAAAESLGYLAADRSGEPSTRRAIVDALTEAFQTAENEQTRQLARDTLKAINSDAAFEAGIE